MMDNRNEKLMVDILKQTYVIPEKYHKKKMEYEEKLKRGDIKGFQSDTRRPCLYRGGVKEAGCWGRNIYRRRNKDGTYTKWGIKPTPEDMEREAYKQNIGMIGKKDADELKQYRQQFKKQRAKSIYELQRMQREQDRERLKTEPDARLKGVYAFT